MDCDMCKHIVYICIGLYGMCTVQGSEYLVAKNDSKMVLKITGEEALYVEWS
jgi:hypothetical protein